MRERDGAGQGEGNGAAEAELQAERRSCDGAAAEELLHRDGGGCEVPGDTGGDGGGNVLGDRESDAAGVHVGVRQGQVAARLFTPRLRPLLVTPAGDPTLPFQPFLPTRARNAH